MTVVAPVFSSVTLCDCLLPTIRLPKSSLEGLVATCPCPSAATPVPDSDRGGSVFDASLVRETAALKFPEALGANLMLRTALCPAAIRIGKLGPVTEKYLVETAELLIVADAFPEFATVTVRVLLLPGVTLPKFRVVAAKERLLVSC